MSRKTPRPGIDRTGGTEDATTGAGELGDPGRWLAMVLETLAEALPASVWPSFSSYVAAAQTGDQKPATVLPIACSIAVGGAAGDAVAPAAAWNAFLLMARVVDSLVDRDRPGLWSEVGVERAVLQGFGLFALAQDLLCRSQVVAERRLAMLNELAEASLIIASGEDRDLAGTTRSVDDCWETIQRKSGRLLSLGCALGAQVGTDDRDLIARCRIYGQHLGVLQQCFNDLDGVWFQAPSDLARGRVTLPVVYGLVSEHPHQEELSEIVAGRALSTEEKRVREILDQAGARRFLLWAALEERNQAIESISGCPGAEGVDFLIAYAEAHFEDMTDLLPAADAAAIDTR